MIEGVRKGGSQVRVTRRGSVPAQRVALRIIGTFLEVPTIGKWPFGATW
jgi:hypothetical protein